MVLRVVCIPFVALYLFACIAPADDDPTTTSPTSEAATTTTPETIPASNEADYSENVGADTEQLTDGQRVVICQAAIGVAGSLGCAAVTVSCAATAVLTVGSVTIPCVLVAAFACAGYVGGSTVILYYCPEYVNR